jgi:hypothetical protein
MSNPLENRWFMSYDADLVVTGQGQILQLVAPGIYLVQYHEWFTGSASTAHLRSLDQMQTEHWAFFETAPALRDWWEHHERHRVDAAVLADEAKGENP